MPLSSNSQPVGVGVLFNNYTTGLNIGRLVTYGNCTGISDGNDPSSSNVQVAQADITDGTNLTHAKRAAHLNDESGNMVVPGQLKVGGAIAPGYHGGGTSNQAHLYSGPGVPPDSYGANGDYYLRTDTPGTANQRLYVKSAGSWQGIL